MNKYQIAIVGAFLGFSLAATSAYAGAYGNWKRPNGTTAKTWKCGGKLCAKVTSGEKKNFNMFKDGIPKSSKNVWKGLMNHPSMGTANFNGTVKLTGKGLFVEGCMLGGLICDEEIWTR